MATTTNYGWTTPDDTALVKDGASAIRSLGSAIDTTTKNLNPGTTNGDLDFYATGTTKSRIAIGSSGQCLTVSAGVPSWQPSATSTLTTTGDLLFASAANTLARRGIGATGDVLTVSGGLPTWAAPASGGMTLISTTTLTGASVTLSSIPQTYNHLYVVIRNYRPVDDNDNLNFRFNADSTASRHRGVGNGITQQSTPLAFGATTISTGVGQDNSVATGFIELRFPDYTNTVTWKKCEFQALTVDATTTTSFQHYLGYGYYNQTNAISSLQFINGGGGNFTSGTILLYGVK